MALYKPIIIKTIPPTFLLVFPNFTPIFWPNFKPIKVKEELNKRKVRAEISICSLMVIPITKLSILTPIAKEWFR